jgi:hypothetical protein
MVAKLMLFTLIVLIIGLLPVWPYSRSWNGGPSSLAAILLFIVIFMMAIGRLPLPF